MTELMKKYEAETGKSARGELYSGSIKLCMPTNDYIAWLEAKAEAYDRLSGGNKTLKEWANVLNMIVTLNFDGNLEIWEKVPTFQAGTWCGDGYVGVLASDCWDYTGDWEDSLTMPDGWEEKE